MPGHPIAVGELRRADHPVEAWSKALVGQCIGCRICDVAESPETKVQNGDPALHSSTGCLSVRPSSFWKSYQLSRDLRSPQRRSEDQSRTAEGLERCPGLRFLEPLRLQFS